MKTTIAPPKHRRMVTLKLGAIVTRKSMCLQEDRCSSSLAAFSRAFFFLARRIWNSVNNAKITRTTTITATIPRTTAGLLAR